MPVDELNKQLHELYADDCCNSLPALADTPAFNNEDEFATMLAGMVKDIYNTKGIPAGSINKEVTNEFAKRLFKGVEKGYGKDFLKVDYDSPDYNMLAAFQKNVWQFSAAKNYTQLRELSNALLDEQGKLRSYKEFEKAAFSINDKHVKHHLKAEYNLAVAGGQMAGKWQGFDKDAMLQFDAVKDGRTTELCARLHGTTLPKSHPFWKTYYPPNHFNCRSTVRQVYGRAATKENDVPNADIPTMFQTNLGDGGLIFPKEHAYFIDLPDNIGTTNVLRRSMRELANKKVVGKIIIVNDIGDVHITKSGIRKCLTQSTPPEFYDKKNLLVPFANRLLENVYEIKLSANKDNPLLKVWHTKVKGLDNFRLVIKEQVHDGKIINVLYSIIAKK